MHKLDSDNFINIVNHAPLVSIDLIVRNDQYKILLGRRRNQPAQGYWFVPGGRIYKNETLDSVFSRICHDELNYKCSRSQARFIGNYEHFYPDNFAGTANIDTHYVVLAYELLFNAVLSSLPDKQHAQYQWFDEEDVVNNPDIHQYTQNYFTP